MKNLIKYPVHYESWGTMILDADQNMVCDIRGWGRILYMENPEEKQDSMGEFIADAINEKMERQTSGVSGPWVIPVGGTPDEVSELKKALQDSPSPMLVVDDIQFPRGEIGQINCTPIEYEHHFPDRETNAQRCGYSTKFKK